MKRATHDAAGREPPRRAARRDARDGAQRTRTAAHLRAIFRAAVAAVDPERLIAAHIDRRGSDVVLAVGRRRLVRRASRLWVAGAGKAAVAMARAVARVAPEADGVVVAPRSGAGQARRASRRIGRIRVLFGEHPIPGRRSFAATRALVAALRCRPETDTVLLLLSGGASSLLAMPVPGVDTRHKTALNRMLLRSGLAIGAMNAVRKHVSAVKGGGLLRLAAPREVVTLALSDVVGDDPATIGSGPAVADPTTFADALAALDRARLRRALPQAVRLHLERGRLLADASGRQRKLPTETLKPGSPLLRRSFIAVVGRNRTALDAAAKRASSLGYAMRRLRAPIVGEASTWAVGFARRLPRRPTRPTCVLAGGEPVVTVGVARGRGGRCQELALAAAPHLAGTGWTLLAAATDGVDGLTPAAGACVGGTTLARAGTRAVARALDEHDSYGFFRRHGGLLRTGSTGTNVTDLVIALHPRRAAVAGPGRRVVRRRAGG